jgi:hypothetical protein
MRLVLVLAPMASNVLHQHAFASLQLLCRVWVAFSCLEAFNL